MSLISPYWPGGGVSRGEGRYQRSGPRRSQGDRSGWVSALGRTRPPDHPLQAPAGPYGTRFAVWGPPCEQRLGGYWSRYSPPSHPPVYPSLVPYRARTTPLPSAYPKVGACPNTRFWDTVGEPRGVEYRGYLALFWHCLALLALYWH